MQVECATGSPTNATSALASHILGYRDKPIDDRAFVVARQCVMDWFAVTLAGLNEPVARIVREEAVRWSRGPCTILGSDISVGPDAAALANGAASHALDYDDVHRQVGHPTVAVLPAVLAVAEERRCSGDQALRAFIAGVEAAAIVGMWAGPSHYARGFHTTATLGSFGAAAAASLLMGLDHKTTTMALGLAGTQAAGLKSMFGHMAKPLHAGKAASNGVLAARLASAGLTAHPDVLGADQGFVQTQSDCALPLEFSPAPRGSLMTDVLFKYHAACYLTHSTIESVRRLCTNGAPPDAIDVHVPKGHLSVCNIPSPATGLEIKFSLRHTAALAALGFDTAAISTYSDDNARDAELVAMRERVTVHGDYRPGTGARIVVRHGNRHDELEVDVGIPEMDLGRQETRLSDKFDSLTAPAVGRQQAIRLRAAILHFQTYDDIAGLLKSGFGSA